VDRRAALKLLLAIPGLQSLAVADLQPADVIVVECDAPVSIEGIAHIKAQIANIWPDHKVIVFDKGFRMRFTRNAVKA
jgi:hypothetical protein